MPNWQVVRQKKKMFSPKLTVTKQRQRNLNEWKKIKIIMNRERGKAYINCNGERKPAKTVFTGILCLEECRLNCRELFTV